MDLPDDEDIPYEEDVLRNPGSVKSWLRYLAAKKNATAKTRNILYERALRNLPSSYKIWHQYLTERRQQVRGRRVTDPAYEAVNNAFERALVFLNKMPRIWAEYCQFLASQKLVTRTRHAYDRALRALPVTQHDKIWDGYLKFVRSSFVPIDTAVCVFRRYLKLESTQAEGFIDFLIRVERFDEAAVELAKLVNDEKFVSTEGKTRHQLWLQLCDIIAHNPDRIVSLPVEQIIRQGLGKFTEMVGRLWTALADYYIRRAHFEKARDIFEEALMNVKTVRDFSVVFDAYSQYEERMIQVKMSTTAADLADADAGDPEALGVDLDLRLARLDRLMDRRPFLLNAVLLRQNPHNVQEWLKRARLYKDSGDDENAVKAYADAVATVDAQKATGKVNTLWSSFARFYEQHDDLDNARAVFEKGTTYAFKNVDDLASLWCDWAEMEVRHKNYNAAIQVLNRATTIPSTRESRMGGDRVHLRVHRATKLWLFLADLHESMGALASARAAYDKMMDLKVATVRAVLNYALLLEENQYFEEAFKAYERGVALFTYPYVMELWVVYLTKFIRRYGGRKLERARDLFEQALEKAPAAEAKTLYMMYARLEEEHGLARRAMAIYQRAVEAAADEDKPQLYAIYLARAAEFFGAAATRPIHEAAIAALPDRFVPAQCVRYAQLERKLGEIDRARAVMGHGAQFADPRLHESFWQAWHDLEVRHGNAETYSDMLRIKRTVQAQFQQVSFTTQADVMKLAEEQAAAAAAAAAANAADLSRVQQAAHGQRGVAFVASKEAAPVNTEEIAIDMEEEGPSIAIETKPVPAAVFGAAAEQAEKEAAAEAEEPKGALARLKGRKK